MKRVVIINGYGACGKDTFVKMFGRAIPVEEDMENISTVDDVKEISKLMGWNGKSKTDDDRRFWSDIKMAWTKYNNGIATRIITRIRESDNKWFFVHCREPEEIQKFVDSFADDDEIICYTLLIVKSGVRPPDNDSDKSVPLCDYDNVIMNDGTLYELSEKACNYYNELK